MTAILTEKNDKYHIVLNWAQDGKRQRKWVATGLSVKGNKRRAEVMCDEVLHMWRSKMATNPSDMLFSDYLRQWVETARKTISETTYAEYKRNIENHLAPYFEPLAIKLAELTAADINEYYRQKYSTGVTANTVHRYHANIHRALKDAVKLDLIPTNVSDKVTLPKKKRFYGSYYVEEELRRLVTHAMGTKLETPILLAAWFGMRRGEAIGVRWSAIDFNMRVLHIRGTITDKGQGTRSENLKYNDFAKTESSIRSFPLEDEHLAYLMRLRQRQLANKELMGNGYNQDWTDFLCVDDLGNLVTPDYVSWNFPKFLEKHGMRKIRFHDLRHTNATLLLNSGASLKEVQDWLGHMSVLTTGNIYGHVLFREKKKLSSAMCGLVGAV